MKTSLLLFSVISVAGAADTVCAEEEQSLLQVQSQPKMRKGLNNVNSMTNPAILLESVTHLAQNLERESPEAVNVAVDSVSSALALMIPLLESQHAAAQQEINHQVEEIQACGSSSSHGLAVRDGYEDQLTSMNQCLADQNTAAEAREEACNVWERRATGLQFPSTILPQHPSAEAVYALAETMNHWVEDEWEQIQLRRNACTDATSRAAAEEERCAPIVAGYDATFCQHQISCTLLVACHDHEMERYNSMRADSESQEDARREQFNTITQAQCLLDHIKVAVMANETISESSFSECAGDIIAVYTAEPDYLHLSFPHAEDPSSCPLPQTGDPHCSEVELPLAWEGGQAAEPQPSAGSAIHFEFCTGPRAGQQFTVTLMAPQDHAIESFEFEWTPRNMGPNHFYGPAYCYDGSAQTSTRGDRSTGMAWLCKSRQSSTAQLPEPGSDDDEGDFLKNVYRTDPDCTSYTWPGDSLRRPSSMDFSPDNCAISFQGWVRKKFIVDTQGCDWCSALPTAMSELGGSGWGIFETIEDDETYKVLSSPSCLL